MRKVCLLVLSACATFAQAKFEYWPGATYNPAVPTPAKVLGYDFGDRISSHANIVRYLKALAAAEPNRMKVFEYGKTWEGRELVYAVIGSEANIKRLPEIRAAMQRLHDPRKTPQAEAQRLMAGHAGDALAGVRRPRQRDFVARRRAGDGVSSAGRAQRQDDRRSFGQRAGDDLPVAESRRPQPLHPRLRSQRRTGAGCQSRWPPNTPNPGPAAAPIIITST